MKNTRSKIWVLIAVILTLVACKKNEYQPPAIGEKIPYIDSVYPSIDEVLKSSPYTLFTQAWLKSGLYQLLKNEKVHDNTFLVLTNEALSRSGWNSEKISSASPAELDLLLSPYVLKGDISISRLQETKTSVIEDSYHSVSGYYYRNDPYYYSFANDKKEDNAFYQKAALAIGEDGKLIVNGKLSGAAAPLPTAKGTLWPIDRMIIFNPKTAWQVLKEDGRFKLYTSVIEYTDSVYHELFYRYNNYYPMDKQAGGVIYYMAETYYHNTPRQQGMIGYTGDDGTKYIDRLNTWFIPTDDAFKKVGFNSLNDLLKYNQQRSKLDTLYVPWQPTQSFNLIGPNRGYFSQPEFIAIKGTFATDTLLDYHGFWGMRSRGYAYWQTRAGLVIFSNDLTKVLKLELPIASLTYQTWNNGLSKTFTTSHNSPLTALSPTKISVPGLAVDNVNISEPDIFTLNGVIHVVDDLFQPNKIR